VAAFRIISEAVTNVRRHAAATTCRVILAAQDDRLDLSVTDDGIGIAAEAVAGIGLTSMREQAAELGGQITVAREACGGTFVHCWLPLGGVQ